MATIREFLTKFTIAVDSSQMVSYRQTVAQTGAGLRHAFDRKVIDQNRDAINRIQGDVGGFKGYISDFGKSARWEFNNLGKQIKSTLDPRSIEQHRDALDKMGNAVGGVRNSFSDAARAAGIFVVAAAGIGAGIAGLFAGVKQTSNYADQIKDTANQLGVSAGDLQALGYVAQLSGSSVEELAQSLKFLSRNAVEASGNMKGEQAEAFRRLGVSVTDTNGRVKSANLLFQEMTDGFARLPEGPERTAVAMTLLGRSGVQMVPLLAQGSAAVNLLKQEAHDLGAVLSDDALMAGAAFNDEFDKLQAVILGVKNSIGVMLLPVMGGLITSFRNFIIENRELIKVKAEKAIEALSSALDKAWTLLKSGYDIISSIVDRFGGLERVVGGVILAFTAFAALNILAAIGSMTMAIGALGAVMLGLKIKALEAAAAQVLAFAIPLAIGAAVALVVLAIEDIYTYLQGGESVFGKWVQVFEGAMASLKGFVIDVGAAIYDFFVQPFIDAFDWINKISKSVTGIDLGKRWGAKDTFESIKKHGGIIDAFKNDLFGLQTELPGQQAPFISPLISPSPGAAGTFSSDSSNISLENNIIVNANGLSPDEARSVVGEEIRKSQADLMKRAGQNSKRKNKE